MKKKLFVCLITIASFILSFNTLRAEAKDTEKVIKQATGIITGNIIGPVVGLTRGFASAWHKGMKLTAKSFGGEDVITYKIIGALTYGMVEGTCGGIVGIFKAQHDAFKYGTNAPFAKENFSLGGNSFLDYDPFLWE